MLPQNIPKGFTLCQPDKYQRVYLECTSTQKGIDGVWRKCNKRFRKSRVPESHAHKWVIVVEAPEPPAAQHETERVDPETRLTHGRSLS